MPYRNMITARSAFDSAEYADRPDRATHSLIVHLPASAGADRVRRHLAALVGDCPALGDLPVWAERVPAGSASPAALRQRDREARRPLRRDGPLVRLVVLEYSSGDADLVVVAHRAVLGYQGLRSLTEALAVGTGTALPAIDPVPVFQPGRAVRPWPGVDWGVPAPATANRAGASPAEMRTARIGGGWPKPVVAAAVALVLARYQAASLVRFGMVATAGGAEHFTAVAIDVDEEMSVRKFLMAADAAVSSPEPGEDAGPAVGLLLSDYLPGARYLPCLAPLFPVTLDLAFDDGILACGACHYDPAAVHPCIAQQFARHIARIADQFTTIADDSPLTEIELLDTEESASILAAGSTAPAGMAPAGTVQPTSIPAAFQAIAEIQPDAVAVCDPERALTYRQLNRRALAAAGDLRRHGVGRGDFVGICLDRTADLIVAMLAVLHTGAAYVPLDPHHPAARLRYIAEDAGLRVVIGSGSGFPPVPGVRVTALAVADDNGGMDASAAAADDPAYVIYTSGSTGRPKGVVVPHQNVCSLIEATRGEMALGRDDIWTLFHAPSFDFSVWEIWGCLLTGGRLVVVPYLTTRSPTEFYDLLVGEGVTILNQTPSAFTNLLQVAGRRGPIPAIRLVIFGGEPLDVQILGTWFALHPYGTNRVVNMFGITETTVHVTVKEITPAEVQARSRSVGRPVPGWSVSVRDQRGRLLPPGAVGELYVGGAGVAAGYLNRQELTAERFFEDPLGCGRVYRSGDLGRLRPDGDIDHLGRTDSQVKIRGHRIELDEIRAVLLEDPSVEAAAVVLSGTDRGDLAMVRLDAYVVLKPGAAASQVRDRAASALPEYMMPTTITPLTTLPLTGNGKLDVSALAPRTLRTGKATPAEGAAPAGGATPAGGVTPAPAITGPQSRLALALSVWQQILGVQVGPDDDFFELGGNSLLAVRLAAAFADAGFRQPSVRELYAHRSVTKLLAHLSPQVMDQPANHTATQNPDQEQP